MQSEQPSLPTYPLGVDESSADWNPTRWSSIRWNSTRWNSTRWNLSSWVLFLWVGLLVLSVAPVRASEPDPVEGVRVASAGTSGAAQTKSGKTGAVQVAPGKLKPSKKLTPPPTGGPSPAPKPGAAPKAGGMPKPTGKPLPPAPPALQEALTLLEGEPLQALRRLLPLLESPGIHPHHRQALLRVAARALERLEFPLLALFLLDESLQGAVGLDEALETFRLALPAALVLREDGALARSAALLDPAKLEPEARGHAHYLRGLALEQEGELKAALAEQTQVPLSHARGVEARLVQTTLFVQLRVRPFALASLEELTRWLDTQPGIVPALRERAWLNLARAAYALDRTEQAEDLYRRIPRASDLWLSAQHELAWTFYRRSLESAEPLESFNRTLGILHGLQSPHFERVWLPEPQLLYVQLLTQLCRFQSAREGLKQFQQRYQPVLAQLKQVSVGPLASPETLLALALTARRGEGPRGAATASPPVPGASEVSLDLLSPMLLQRWRARPDLERIERLLTEAHREQQALELLGRTQPDLPVQSLSTRLSVGMQARVKQAGQRLQRELDEAQLLLKTALVDVELFELNLLTGEKERYEAAARTGKALPVKARGTPRALRRRDTHVWPFEGEYWSDELGYLEGVARPECPD